MRHAPISVCGMLRFGCATYSVFTVRHAPIYAVGKGIDAEKLGKAIRISEEKYCSVYATLKDAIEITHEYEVVEE